MWPMRLKRICLAFCVLAMTGLLFALLTLLASRNSSSIRLPTSLNFVGEESSASQKKQHPENLLHEEKDSDGARVRILCWVMTQPQNYNSKARAVNATWAPRCDGYFFFSSDTGNTKPTGLPLVSMKLVEDRDQLWDKTQAAFMYIYEHYLNDYDFFLKADDDSYIIVDNLRYFLRNTKATEPVFAGRRFRPYTKNGYMSGGGSYVLSRAAVKALVEKAFKKENNFCRKHGGAEDVNMGNCLENVGVSILDSIDEKGRERFHPFDAASHIDYANWPKDFWLWKYNYHPIKVGLDCCSSTAISFHYIRPVDMLTLHYFIYQLRAYGVSADSVRHGANGVPLASHSGVKGRV
ncbi:hypothetical protein BOX15_Mlig016758g1 [Macrostomum lignano]|nr:hypothetical protein BOX15_Mlig016758g1 [Macrostomum lignano]